MAVYGIGTDILSRPRIDRLYSRFGIALAKRILSGAEYACFESSTDPAGFIAKRFAAKEALAKALGTGLRHPVSLRRISLLNDPLGRPVAAADPLLQDWLDERGIVRLHVSISDDGGWIAAFALAETA